MVSLGEIIHCLSDGPLLCSTAVVFLEVLGGGGQEFSGQGTYFPRCFSTANPDKSAPPQTIPDDRTRMSPHRSRKASARSDWSDVFSFFFLEIYAIT